MSHEQRTLLAPGNLEALQEGRFNLAVESTNKQLRSVFANDRIENPNVDVTRVTNVNHYYNSPLLSPAVLMGYEALGVDAQTAMIAATAAGYQAPAELVKSVEADGEQLDVYTHEGSLGLQFSVQGQESSYYSKIKPVAIKQMVSQRFAQSPAHRAMSRANMQLQESTETPHGVRLEPFNPTVDPLGTLAFLEDMGLVTGLGYRLNTGQKPDQLLKTALVDVPHYRAQHVESDDAETFQWGDGITKSLRIDKVTGTYTFSAIQDPAATYLERSNQSDEKAVPFVETPCAAELCSLLDRAGLMFHPELQVAMMSADESDRYGSIYTQLSREIAKGVNNPKRLWLSKLFVPYDEAFSPVESAVGMTRHESHPVYMYEQKRDNDPDDYDIEATVRGLWSGVRHETGSESAAALISMIDGSLARKSGINLVSELPVTRQEVKIRSGACFDVVGYYLGSLETEYIPSRLHHRTENGVSFVEKTNGAHTYLTTRPINFNGVELPKGALFTRNEDGWAFLRLTMFSFDTPDDQVAAAGSELAKAQLNQAIAIKKLGGVTLSHLEHAMK